MAGVLEFDRLRENRCPSRTEVAAREARAGDTPRIGQMLVERGLLTPARLEKALAEQKRTGDPLGQILLARGWVRALDFYRALAEHFGLPFVNLVENPPDADLFDPARAEEYARCQYLPWRSREGSLRIAVAEPSEGLFRALREHYGENTEFVVTSRFDVLWTIQRLASEQLTHRATLALWDQAPQFSARIILSWRQWIAFYLALSAWAWAVWQWTTDTLLATNAVLTLFLTAAFLLRSALVWRTWRVHRRQGSRPRLGTTLPEAELPVYSILVPLYRDAAVVPVLATALRRLDYPPAKLDIKLVLEEDDRETIEACKQAGLEANVELVRVPPGHPRTKPKALNYALSFARGEFVTIYDAEDVPEPSQLRRAVEAFRQMPPEVACVQARLNYFNWDENWLTRLFTLEYSLWFDWYLPGLESLGIPFPLGGTSNHFRAEVLRSLGGWDPFNVTEDADLGLRFTQHGWRVATLDSTTYEEANSRVGNWIRQRSRWIKGYIQTYLVHMRHPLRLARRLGAKGFLGFQFFIGGAFVAPLSFLPLAALFALWQISRTSWIEALFPPWLWTFAAANLIVAGIALCLFHMIAAWKRGRRGLAWWALLLPVYYLLMSLAAYKALWQLVRRPHYWEKTEHGLTRHDAIRLLSL
jgi:cellulose synthase/poly-beta-1,6-N-acetylglucosamine synthase-like glycosyltransferase